LPVKSFKYALLLADSIQIQAYAHRIKYAKRMWNIMELGSSEMRRTPRIDVIIKMKDSVTKEMKNFKEMQKEYLALEIRSRKEIVSPCYPLCPGEMCGIRCEGSLLPKK